MIEFNPIRKTSVDADNASSKLNLIKNITVKDKVNNLLLIRSANECLEQAKNQPIPKMLFSEFWHQGELSILFADTNIGKSILSVQIANAISSGKAIRGFKMEAAKQVVLYFDFEMGIKQFEKRYSANYTNHYQFDDNFLRIEINPNCMDYEDFERTLFEAIEDAIGKYDAKVLIVDNLTYLKSQTTETAKEALPLMKALKGIKLRHNLSILALAHTPKRSPFQPITHNDLAGSKHLANFADSIFAIGASNQDKSLRYIKQLKARDTEIIYDTQNVILCEVSQPTNFLGFEFVDFAAESEHLKPLNDNEHHGIEASIITLQESEPNISRYEIAQRLGINQMKVKRTLEKQESATTLIY